MDTNPRNNKLIDFLDVLVDLYENIIKAAEHEIYDRFKDANNIWKQIFGDDFPNLE